MRKIISITFFSLLFPIVGGWEVDPECPECKYPFNVSLQTYEYYILSALQPDLPTLWDGHFCQGALIDNNWVLTNANCVDIVENNMHIWAEVGLHNINDEISTQADSIAISNIYFHPNYNPEEPWHYNYALLELSNNSAYEPIKLISDYNHENIGNPVTLMGWGARSWAFSWIHAYLLFENNSTIGECLDGWNGDESLLCLNPWDLDDYEDWGMENIFEEGFPGGGCNGDEGASLIMTNDDGEYELLGHYFLGCILDYPHQNKFSRTYIVKDWIYSYIGYPDTDNDGVDDVNDNCPEEYNPYQLDYDNDAQGNVCDLDDDNDGVEDINDNCPEEYNPSQSNFDGDEQGDVCDFDDDNDGVIDTYDPNDNDVFICGDSDEDNCDDCSSGTFDINNDCQNMNCDGNLIEIVINSESPSNIVWTLEEEVDAYQGWFTEFLNGDSSGQVFCDIETKHSFLFKIYNDNDGICCNGENRSYDILIDGCSMVDIMDAYAYTYIPEYYNFNYNEYMALRFSDQGTLLNSGENLNLIQFSEESDVNQDCLSEFYINPINGASMNYSWGYFEGGELYCQNNTPACFGIYDNKLIANFNVGIETIFFKHDGCIKGYTSIELADFLQEEFIYFKWWGEDVDDDCYEDDLDNCSSEYNPYQSDFDGDLQGDTCDFDDDNDGVVDVYDSNDYNPFICGDSDEDGCDDCFFGSYDPSNNCECNLGDFDCNGQINVIDIVMIVDIILNNSYDFVSDINEDGLLNVIDIVILIDIILNP
tara:strand:- start:148 stop:2433 length:2286 start_codon:yes stop_codon:yes gene_type:complete